VAGGIVTKKSDEKVTRLAHKILTKTIWPANLKLVDAVDVAISLIKGLVISNTEEGDVEERAEMIEWVEERFMTVMYNLNPTTARPHIWCVTPQGLITEPTCFLWSGSGKEGVEVAIGMDAATVRATLEEAGAQPIVIEGVDGIAMTDPEWDGEPTITCGNPQCGKTHDVHLMCAENLFQQAKQRSATN
jgi:hypothetical protein